MLGVKLEKDSSLRWPLCSQRMDDDEEIAVGLTIFGQTLFSPIDTPATSIWVGEAWFRQNGEKINPRGGSACGADKREIRVANGGVLDFQMQGTPIIKDVRVVNTVSSKVLVGTRFWRKNNFWLDLKRSIHNVR